MSVTAADKETGREIKGRHVLHYLVAFFGVIFAVNGYFLYSALRTHTGVVAEEPYRKGLAYNERIAADEAQAKLGWTVDHALGADGHLAVRIRDGAGVPVTGLRIAGTLGRPSTAKEDHKLLLAEQRPGDYEADVGRLETGTWLLAAEAKRTGSGAGEIVYRLRRRVWLKP